VTPAQAIRHALEALDFSEDAVRAYTHYPSYEFQCERLNEIKESKKVLRQLRDSL
jgi:hypothetical protein